MAPFQSLHFDGLDSGDFELPLNHVDSSEDSLVQLKSNLIPKGLVTLESLFDRRDCCFSKNVKEVEKLSSECEKVNIGLEDNPVNLGQCYNELERNKFLKLLKAFGDVFSWYYKDLKDFRQGKFKHQVPLKPDMTPFR